MAIFSFIRRLMLVLSGPANDLVFLSYSNGDTGKNFSDHLNSALTRAGLRTFRNADDTRRGENTESETRKAIQESKISVIVFSKDYAFSTRCLDNVVMIMDAREATGHIVLPIFYHLDPSEVRNQEGRYFEAFSAHEEGFQGEVGRVEEWRAALRKAADVAGMVVQDRYEARFIESIVEEIADKLNLSRSSGFTTVVSPRPLLFFFLSSRSECQPKMRQNTSLLDCCLLGDSGSLLRTCKNKRIGGGVKMRGLSRDVTGPLGTKLVYMDFVLFCSSPTTS